MNPKKATKLYTEVAEELNVSASFVEELTSFYYNNLRQMLSNLTDPRINVEGLGHFVVKTNLVRKIIPRSIKSLEDHDTYTFAAYFNKKKVETKLEQLIELEKKIVEQENKKVNFKKLKYENNAEDNLEK